jgi:hypothetical protein
MVYKKDSVNIALEIKKLLAEKRKARAKWQRSHTPSDKTTFKQAKQHPQITTESNEDKLILKLWVYFESIR